MDSVSSIEPSLHWEAESLRLTAFPVSPLELKDNEWWKEIVGQEPENRIEKPRRMRRDDEGPYGSGRLLLRIQPFRVDWILKVPEPINEAEGKVGTLGPLEKVLPSFADIMKKWLANGPPLQRLAFGAVLNSPAENRIDGYKALTRYLPYIKMDVEGSSDLLFQINRPRLSTSGVKSLLINRLSKWSVVILQAGELSFETVGEHFTTHTSLFACHLELDINTAADYKGELPKQALIVTFDELVNLGKEITIKGDIK